MEIKVIKSPMRRGELAQMAQEGFGDMVKVVVDVVQGIAAAGGELHADEEVILMEHHGSQREHTWGINIYPAKPYEEQIEFDSMVNLKPAYGNRSRGVEDTSIQDKIRQVVTRLVVD